MPSFWARWRAAILLTGAACAIIATLIVLFGGDGGAREGAKSAAAQGSKPAAASPEATRGAQPPATPPVGSFASLRPAQPATAATTASPWPEPPKHVEGVSATWDPNFGDPFEGDGGRPTDVRELVRVGDFRLGVTNRSKVRDEKKVAELLREVGAEIDRKDRGRTDAYERRVNEYGELLDGYRAKLAPYMDGAFALKGNGWTETLQLDPQPKGGGDAG